MAISLQGHPPPSAAPCKLVPTGSWSTYKSISCFEPGQFSADSATGMMPDLTVNFTGANSAGGGARALADSAAAELARVDAFNWVIIHS
jgi:hypothetical protein